MNDTHRHHADGPEHEHELEGPPADQRLAGEPDAEELISEGRDPGWPIPGLAGPPPEEGSPASDADAPAPG